MKKFVLLVAVAFLATTLVGCSKKKKEDSSMDGLNGVASENVVSVTDNNAQAAQNQEVPVVVDNADANAAMAQPAAEAPAVSAPVAGKPTPKQIQQALKNAGFYNGKVDGDIGPKTKKAIEAFQSQNGLKADGKVGAKTWKALSSYLNKAPEVENPSSAAQSVEQ